LKENYLSINAMLFFIEIPNIPLSHQFLKFITALDHLEENNRDLVFFEVS